MLVRGFFSQVNKFAENTFGVAAPQRAQAKRVDRETWLASVKAQEVALEAENTHTRTFDLKAEHARDTAAHPLRVAIFGCQGSGNKHQTEVAKMLADVCANPETRPDFIVVLGDNVYDYGAHFAADPSITECFDNIYLQHESLNGIPFFVILGNHDGGFQNKAVVTLGKASNSNLQTGYTQSMHEVAHSYMPSRRLDKERGEVSYTTENKKTIYSNPALNLADLPSWNMPRRYYALNAGDVKIFCLDSSTYVREYLDAEINNADGTHTAENNQALWLKDEIEKTLHENDQHKKDLEIYERQKANASGKQLQLLRDLIKETRAKIKKIVFAQHHPLHTAGKNAYHNDVHIYLNDKQAGQARALLELAANSSIPYSTFLLHTFKRQGIRPDQVWNAHDHNINYFNNRQDPNANYPFCQITSGGGGGDLQERALFTQQHNTGCFLKEYGFCLVTHTTGTDEFNFSIRTTNGTQLEFNNQSAKSVIANPANGVEEFITTIEAAIEKYLAPIGYDQHQSNGKSLGKTQEHGADGIDRAHNVWAYIRSHQPAGFSEMVQAVEKMVNNYWGTPGESSLITFINKETLQSYGKTIHELAESCKIAKAYAGSVRLGM